MAEGSNGLSRNHSGSSSRLTTITTPTTHQWSWECPMSMTTSNGIANANNCRHLILSQVALLFAYRRLNRLDGTC